MIKASGKLVADKVKAAAEALKAMPDGHRRKAEAYYAELHAKLGKPHTDKLGVK